MTTNGDSPIVWSIWQASSCRPHKGLGRGECHMKKKTVRDVDVAGKRVLVRVDCFQAEDGIRDVDVAGKRVLVRVDFNVPLRDRRVFDDTRIRAALPTIEYLRGEGAKVILVSHLGRPDGREDPALRLDPVVRRLSDLLGVPVRKTAALVGLEVTEAVGALRSEGVLVLENSRFHPGETQNDQTLSKQLADLADVFVNDAFGAAHRAHATTAGVAEHLPAVAGLLMEKELGVLDSLLSNPKRPFVVVLGGIKVSEKIGVIRKFLQFADELLIGGAMCFTFFAAQGWQ